MNHALAPHVPKRSLTASAKLKAILERKPALRSTRRNRIREGPNISSLARFDSSHGNRGDTVCIENPDGSKAFHCAHNSCSGNKWQEYQAKVGIRSKPPTPHSGGNGKPIININQPWESVSNDLMKSLAKEMTRSFVRATLPVLVREGKTEHAEPPADAGMA